MSPTARSDAGAPYVIVGRIRKAHGIRGELVIEPITDAPEAVFAPGRRVFAGTRTGDIAPDRHELHVERSSPFKEGMIVAFREIIDRTAAELWRDRYLLLPHDETTPLDEGEVYMHELLGMDVRLASGESFGHVAEIYDLPQGLALDVKPSDSGATIILLYDQSVVAVDRDARVVTVEIPEGLLD
jgi:16S rRNA processing protein RimM